MYDIFIQNNLEGIRLDDSWTSLVDLREDESVQIGKRHFKSPIAVVPSQGYTKRDNYSKISIQWLEWLMEKSRQRGNSIAISHALNGGEYQVPGTNYRCDGFAKTPTGKGTIYEFYGKNLLSNTCPFPLNWRGGAAAAAAYLNLITDELRIYIVFILVQVVCSTVVPPVSRTIGIPSNTHLPIRP